MDKRIAGAVFAAALALAAPIIYKYEGTVPTGYSDPIGKATACTGHTGPDVIVGKYYTREQCEKWFIGDAYAANETINRLVKIPIADNVRAAMISFIFNLGSGNFSISTMLKLLNQGKIVEACNELPKWNKAGGKVLPGLVARRAAEQKICLGL